ncbi:MAG: ABC transporter permease [Anaerolineales bacterium]|nr:ABC transporter permease [Anaerolineales bacterium]MBS3753177.1 ABC transporter permease [Anaerolineales bacterium]
MIKFVAQRFSSSLVVLLVVSLLIFVVLDTVPGDAAETIIGDSASQEQLDELRQEMGLDETLLPRYFSYIKDMFMQGDMGDSLITGKPVWALLANRLPSTLLLTLTATTLATTLGIALGVFAATNKGSPLDTLIIGLSTLGMAVPTFWSGLLLMLLAAPRLNLPLAGGGSIRHLILPSLTLAFPTMAVVARLSRSSVLDGLNEPYVQIAEAKGLPYRRILFKHVLRNGLIPLINLLGLQLGHLLGGAFIVETIFGWPGLGRLTVQAIFDRDYPIVMGAALTMAAAYLMINFIVDMSHAWLDPRVAQKSI